MKTAYIGIRITETDKEKLEAKATEKDVPVSQLIREAIKKFINEEN